MSDQPEEGVGGMSEESAGHQEAVVQPPADTGKYKIVVDGNEVEVPLTELINGYQRQSDYTRKTQELAKARERQNKEIEDKAVELYMKAMERQNGGSKQAQEPDFNGKLKELEEKFQQSEQARREAEANQFLDRMQKDLASKYEKMDWEKVLVRFHNANRDGSNEDPKAVFDRLAKESHDSELKREQTIIDGYVKKKSSNPHSKGELGGSTMPAGKKSDPPPKTFEEARERAERRFNS